MLWTQFPVFFVCVLQKLGSSMQCEEGTEWLLELLMEVQLQQYFLRVRDDLNVTRLSHFDYVKNEDLEKIGMGRPGEELCVCVCRFCCTKEKYLSLFARYLFLNSCV